MAKTENCIKRMRWKALEFLGKLPPNGKENYGFRSKNCPSVVKEMSKFEEDFITMVKNVEFRTVNCDFQNKMKEDIETIKRSGKIIVPADKSTNLYKMNKDDYERHLTANITTTYKKTNQTKVNLINKQAYKIANKLGIDNRMQSLQESQAYITIKDHKENFPANPSFRLINPSKTDVGKISKQILDRINKDLLPSVEVNQWRNTKSAIQ